MDERRAGLLLRAGGIVVASFAGVMLLARADLPVLAANLLHVPALLFAWRRVWRRGSED